MALELMNGSENLLSLRALIECTFLFRRSSHRRRMRTISSWTASALPSKLSGVSNALNQRPDLLHIRQFDEYLQGVGKGVNFLLGPLLL